MKTISNDLIFFGMEGEVPGDISRFSLEEIRHEDLVFVAVVRGGEDIGALERLREVAEDVVDVKQCFGGIGWAGDI